MQLAGLTAAAHAERVSRRRHAGRGRHLGGEIAARRLVDALAELEAGEAGQLDARLLGRPRRTRLSPS